MDYFSAIILGIVEGLTEFIPVSSTGHLILLSELLGVKEGAVSFELFIQIGAILAVVVLYLPRFLALLNFNDREHGLSGYQGLVKLAIGCAPAFTLGALCHKAIKEQLFNPTAVAVALALGGIVMIILEKLLKNRSTHEIDQLTYGQALVIGVAQSVALWPGMSRSASTIIGGMFAGLSRKASAEFSFLLAVPTLCGAVAYDVLKNWQNFTGDMLPFFAVGFVVSFVVAIVSIKFFMSLLNRWTLKPFGFYRILLALFILLVWRP